MAHHPPLRGGHVTRRQDVDEEMVDGTLRAGQDEAGRVRLDLGQVADLAVRALDLHGLDAFEPVDGAGIAENTEWRVAKPPGYCAQVPYAELQC